MSSPFNLKSFAAVGEREEEGVWVDVKHVNGEPWLCAGQVDPLRIKVAGSYAPKAKAAGKRIREQGAEADYEKIGVMVLAASTLEWQACADDDGTPIPLSVPNARMLYEAAPWIADQVARGAGNHALFFPVSSLEP